MSLRPGMVLDHRYELLRRLGEGGQGSVWRAHDRSTGEDRALKIVPLPAQNREALDRARREARLVQDARHPALVRCHSLVEIPGDDIVVLVFDFVEATSLAEAMSDSRFERMHRLAVLRHTAQALAFLHERGIVHRDIKPDNVLLTSVFYEDVAAPDAIRIIDFGIAAPQEGAGGTTLSGRFGTPAYMAPELFEIVGVDSQRSAARDVYAFGVMAWELLHGGHPTGVPIRSGAGVFSALYASLRPGREPWPPKKLDGRWGAVVDACLALDPSRRPADGRAILARLGSGSPTPLPGPVSPGHASLNKPSARSGTAAHVHPAGGGAQGSSGHGSATEEHAVPPISAPPEGGSPPGSRAVSEAAVAGRESRPSAESPLVRTEIAPQSSLPKSQLAERTTPMPPDIDSLLPPVSDTKPSPGAEPPAPEPEEREPVSEPPREGIAGLIALALLLCGVVLAVSAWALLGRNEPPPERGTPPPPHEDAPAALPDSAPALCRAAGGAGRGSC
ncbi:MAG: protein kinase [Polyangiaceae bacterium]